MDIGHHIITNVLLSRERGFNDINLFEKKKTPGRGGVMTKSVGMRRGSVVVWRVTVG